MRRRICLLSIIAWFPAFSQLQSGPPLPHKLVADWAKLPKGWNFGECSGLAVDKDDGVWVVHRGQRPVIQLDRNGNVLQSWGDGLFKSVHAITLDSDGNPWIVDVLGHVVFKFSREGRVQLVLGARQGVAGNNDSKEEFNQPSKVAFAPNGDFFVSDGYVNSRVVKYSQRLEYLQHWGSKGKGDGEFDLVHDVVLDSAIASMSPIAPTHACRYSTRQANSSASGRTPEARTASSTWPKRTRSTCATVSTVAS